MYRLAYELSDRPTYSAMVCVNLVCLLVFGCVGQYCVLRNWVIIVFACAVPWFNCLLLMCQCVTYWLLTVVLRCVECVLPRVDRVSMFLVVFYCCVTMCYNALIVIYFVSLCVTIFSLPSANVLLSTITCNNMKKKEFMQYQMSSDKLMYCQATLSSSINKKQHNWFTWEEILLISM